MHTHIHIYLYIYLYVKLRRLHQPAKPRENPSVAHFPKNSLHIFKTSPTLHRCYLNEVPPNCTITTQTPPVWCVSRGVTTLEGKAQKIVILAGLVRKISVSCKTRNLCASKWVVLVCFLTQTHPVGEDRRCMNSKWHAARLPNKNHLRWQRKHQHGAFRQLLFALRLRGNCRWMVRNASQKNTEWYHNL